jgi:hypothetical protein
MALVLSSEQRKCVSSAARGKHCVIKACCGAGKTRVLIGAALEYPRSRVLILSFNRALAEETKSKLVRHRNVDVFTIHKCASLVYGRTVPDNRTLSALIDSNAPMHEDYSNWDLIEFDEGQDVFGVQIVFASLLVAHQKIPPALLVVGDNAQTLYEFLHSDGSQSLLRNYAALTYPGARWTEMSLLNTQRLTPEIATFVNKYFRHPDDPPLVSAKEPSGRLPEVVIGSDRELLSLVEDLTKRHPPGDLMILCNSLRSRTFAPVETFLVRRGVPVHSVLYTQGQDDGELERISARRGVNNNNTPKGKVVLSTFHRAKGLERPIVLVVGLTASYWCMEQSMHNGAPCASAPAHVSVTRGMQHLILFMHSYQGLYPTIPSVKDMSAVAKVRSHRHPESFDEVVRKDAERKERKRLTEERNKTNGVVSTLLFSEFGKWVPEAQMAAFAKSVRKIKTPEGWWGGSNWDDDGPPESEDSEIELLSSLEDDIITNAVNIYLTGFDCPAMEEIHEAVTCGRRAMFRYHHPLWTPRLNAIALPWAGAKTSAKALELAIVHDGMHATRVGGIGERMRVWEEDSKRRCDMEKGFATLVKRIKMDLSGTDVDFNVLGETESVKGVVDIVSDGHAVAFTTSDEANLTESALRRVWWGTKLLGGSVKLYFLKSYTSAFYFADGSC